MTSLRNVPRDLLTAEELLLILDLFDDLEPLIPGQPIDDYMVIGPRTRSALLKLKPYIVNTPDARP